MLTFQTHIVTWCPPFGLVMQSGFDCKIFRTLESVGFSHALKRLEHVWKRPGHAWKAESMTLVVAGELAATKRTEFTSCLFELQKLFAQCVSIRMLQFVSSLACGPCVASHGGGQNLSAAWTKWPMRVRVRLILYFTLNVVICCWHDLVQCWLPLRTQIIKHYFFKNNA